MGRLKTEAKRLKKDAKQPAKTLQTLDTVRMNFQQAQQQKKNLRQSLLKSQQALKMAKMSQTSLLHENESLKLQNQELHNAAVENKDLKAQVSELQASCHYMETLLQDNKEIELFDEDSKRYKPETV